MNKRHNFELKMLNIKDLRNNKYEMSGVRKLATRTD